ncbi:ABC transporter ATP-binding protein [Salisaeta longa]|uniref:ABC transporter ATP-binding protein n=1 Tax=Salisaeta longa TaxID=503170 RepID=UPI0003B76DE5|nr:ABC transporter ATP-binding protein [Salisaeta longa]
MPTPAVHIQHVTHRYGTQRALHDLSLRIPQGALFGMLGPNGSGKTTLFRILSTLLAPTEGTVSVLGASPVHAPHAVRKHLGVVFQSVALDEHLTVRENLRFQGALYGLRGAAFAERMRTLLARFGLSDRTDDRVSTLSGGLQRRVDLVRGLLHRPQVLLLDEPTTGLDPAARRTLWDALRQLQADEGTTLIVATHLMDEADRCDTVAILSEGACVVNGPPEALKTALGEQTLWIESPAPADLRDRIEAQMGVAARVIGTLVQVQTDQAPEMLPRIYRAFGARITAATLRPPTLEDVFLAHTGRSAAALRAPAQ